MITLKSNDTIYNKAFWVLLFFFIFLFIPQINAQNGVFRNDNKLTYNGDQSYKTIKFIVGHIETDTDLNSLLSLLKSDSAIFSAKFDMNTKECQVDAKVTCEKAHIIDLTGKSGYKVSNYSEKVILSIQMPKISYEEREKIEYEREEQNRILNNWPADFPKYINTGNTEKDNADYKQRKDNWILKNAEKYNSISSSPKKYETEAEKKERIEKEKRKKTNR